MVNKNAFRNKVHARKAVHPKLHRCAILPDLTMCLFLWLFVHVLCNKSVMISKLFSLVL